jgi:hypothetical protein
MLFLNYCLGVRIVLPYLRMFQSSCRSDAEINISYDNKTHNHIESSMLPTEILEEQRDSSSYKNPANADVQSRIPTLRTKHHHHSLPPLHLLPIPPLEPPLPTPINHQLLTHSSQSLQRPTSLNSPLSIQSRQTSLFNPQPSIKVQ